MWIIILSALAVSLVCYWEAPKLKHFTEHHFQLHYCHIFLVSWTRLLKLINCVMCAPEKPVWVQKREIPSASGRRSSLYRHTGTSLLDPVHISPRGVDPGGQIDRCPPPPKKKKELEH